MGWKKGKWHLPSSPDSRDYTELLEMIEAEREKNPKNALAWFAAVAETDFWFWQWQVMPLGKLLISDKYHKRKGQPVVKEAWFFDRMREVQEDMEAGRSDVLYYFMRGSYKTTAITQGGSLYKLARDHPSSCTCGACPAPHTIAIFTHKVDKVGSTFGRFFVSQLRHNKILLRHWPQFRNPSKISETAITIDRQEGPHEPSISVHPILGSAAGGHYTDIYVDDAVTERIARSPEECATVEAQLSFIQPLRTDSTIFTYVGTPYGEADPIWKKAQKGGFFSKVVKRPALLPGNIPQLFSLRHFKDLQRTMESQFWESQYMLRIVPRGGAYFRREWVAQQRGDGTWAGKFRAPVEVAAQGARIHIVVDMADGKSPDADFSVVRVYAFTYEKKRIVLDLWREKIGLTDTADLLFGVMPGDEGLPENAWKPPGGLVRRWQKYDPDLDILVEEVGASGHAETFRREMRHRSRHGYEISCPVRGVRSQRKKESRIAKLQPEYRNGAILYPETGFGHGSFTTDDNRDVFQQFLEDEFSNWTLAGETLNDDLLDTEAWTAQEEVFLSYPDVAPDSRQDRWSRELDRYLDGVESSDASWREASWRVF